MLKVPQLENRVIGGQTAQVLKDCFISVEDLKLVALSKRLHVPRGGHGPWIVSDFSLIICLLSPVKLRDKDISHFPCSLFSV